MEAYTSLIADRRAPGSNSLRSSGATLQPAFLTIFAALLAMLLESERFLDRVAAVSLRATKNNGGPPLSATG